MRIRLAVFGLLLAFVLQQPAVAQIHYRGPSSSGTPRQIAAFSATEQTATTTGTVEQVLYSWTIPGNTFRQTGGPVGFGLLCHYTTAANTNSKRVRLRVSGIGGTLLADQVTTTSADVIYAQTECIVTSATSIGCAASRAGISPGAVGAGSVGSLNFANALNPVCTGISNPAGEIVLRAVQGWWLY